MANRIKRSERRSAAGTTRVRTAATSTRAAKAASGKTSSKRPVRPGDEIVPPKKKVAASKKAVVKAKTGKTSAKVTSKSPVEKTVKRTTKSSVVKDEKPLLLSVRTSERGKTVISIKEFKGKHYLDFRHFFLSDGEEGDKWLPTKKGTSIPLNKSVKTVRRITRMLNRAEEQGLAVEEEETSND
jgi:Transcriptional Coactivator p15 (PC4)